jgi:hypothetical protein
MAHLINKDAVRQAKEAARNTFNSLPFETRNKLANGYERLSEVELLLNKGDNLSMAYIKKRKRELENGLLEWYKETKHKTMELQEVIDYARDQYKTDLEKQIAEKLVRLGAEDVKYAADGKWSFNHGVNVGQSKALSWVLEQLENEHKSCTTNE